MTDHDLEKELEARWRKSYELYRLEQKKKKKKQWMFDLFLGFLFASTVVILFKFFVRIFTLVLK